MPSEIIWIDLICRDPVQVKSLIDWDLWAGGASSAPGKTERRLVCKCGWAALDGRFAIRGRFYMGDNMTNSTDRRLVALLCINALLVTALVACHLEVPQAYAQVRSHDYLLIPGSVAEDEQAVWIIDLASFRLTSCVYDRARKRINVGEVLNLSRQFR